MNNRFLCKKLQGISFQAQIVNLEKVFLIVLPVHRSEEEILNNLL